MNKRPLQLYVLLLCVLSFIPFGGGVYHAFVEAVTDAGHFPAFFLLALLIFAALSRSGLPPAQRICATLIPALLFAFLIEVIQPLVGRNGEMSDFYRGSLGALFAALAVALWRLPRSSTRVLLLTLHILSFLFLLLIFSLPAYGEFRALQWRSANFPLLGCFTDNHELRLWRPIGAATKRAIAPAASDNRECGTLSVQTKNGDVSYPGASYDAGGFDWSPFTVLLFTVCISDSKLALGLRVDDDKDCGEFEDRFNQSLAIERGCTAVKIPVQDLRVGPKNRELNLHSIRRLLIFVDSVKHQESTRFELREVRLK
jgi:VanZ family protein